MAKLTSFITTQSSRGENRERQRELNSTTLISHAEKRPPLTGNINALALDVLKTMKIIQNVIKSIMKIINLLNDRIDRRRCSKLLHAMPSL